VSELIVLSFPTEADAAATLNELRGLEKQGQVHFNDTAIVTRDPDGTAHVRNELSSATETGATVGAIIGGLVFLAFPVVGIVGGALAGGAIGAATKSGVSGEFVKELQDQIEPGSSALFLVLDSANVEAVRPVLSRHPGRLVQTSLDSEVEESLRMALHDRSGA
jgi:uncharacterized membrane protein